MAIKITKDGRTLRSGKDYTDFRLHVFYAQVRACSQCGRTMIFDEDPERDWSFHINHIYGRGGGKRDDVMFRDGKQMVRGDCGKCHRIFHGQQSAVQSEPQWSRK